MNPNRRTLNWLTTRLASYLGVRANTISPTVPLAEIGVDSVYAVGLAADVEERFGIDVEPTMVYDYPTLAQIAEYIGTAVAEQKAAS